MKRSISWREWHVQKPGGECCGLDGDLQGGVETGESERSGLPREMRNVLGSWDHRETQFKTKMRCHFTPIS